MDSLICLAEEFLDFYELFLSYKLSLDLLSKAYESPDPDVIVYYTYFSYYPFLTSELFVFFYELLVEKFVMF
jgi:hypothetical protein